MTSLYAYGQDGAHPQSRAVLAYLQHDDGIEESWSDEHERYMAEPKVARWENCREQGYVVSMRSKDYSRQINIAFFEHRNTDAIAAVKWEQITLNSPTIGTAEFGNIYKDKYDVSHYEDYGKATEMADWINKQLKNFWIETEKGGK